MSVTDTRSVLEAALDYARRGIPVVPLHDLAAGYCSCPPVRRDKTKGGRDCKTPGKHPRIDGWQNVGTTTEETIRRWWLGWPHSGVGGPTGMRSGRATMDVDPRNGGTETLARLVAEHGPLPRTWTRRTAGGGLHYDFVHPGDQMYTKITLGPGVELLLDGQQTVLPPTATLQGVYAWEVSPDDAERALLPAWVVPRLEVKPPDPPGGRPRQRRASAPGQEPTRKRSGLHLGIEAKEFFAKGARLVRDGAEKSQRDALIAAVANAWSDTDLMLTADTIEAMAWQGIERSDVGDPGWPWTREEVEAIVDDVLSREAPDPKPLEPTAQVLISGKPIGPNGGRPAPVENRPQPESGSAPAAGAAAEVPADDAATLLDDLYQFLGRFVAYPSEHARVAHTLWVPHAHLMDAWETTPRIAFLSPEVASGKTRALEVSELVVPRPVEAVNVTPAYLFRKVAAPEGRPTILYDEIDTVFGPKAKDNEEIRGLLNAGYRKGAVAGRCVVEGKRVKTEEIEAYCGVALAGLGALPETVLSRSLVVRMRRRAPGEKVESFRRRIHAPQGHRLRDRLARWAAAVAPRAGETYPAMPPGIEDRDADMWEPLLAVAALAGEAWLGRARAAAVALVADSKQSTPSLGVRLLGDLRDLFGQADEMATEAILAGLCALEESPWAELVAGKPLNARGLANYLRAYGVKSQTVRVDGKTPKGYTRAALADAWARYVSPSSPESATSATSATDGRPTPSGVADVADVADLGDGRDGGTWDAGAPASDDDAAERARLDLYRADLERDVAAAGWPWLAAVDRVWREANGDDPAGVPVPTEDERRAVWTAWIADPGRTLAEFDTVWSVVDRIRRSGGVGEGAGRPFEVTADWRPIPEGVVLPNGVEVRVDLETGRNRVRWPPGTGPRN